MRNHEIWTICIERNKERKQKLDKYHNVYIHVATDLLRGNVMHVSGLPTQNFSSDLLEEFLNKYAPVAYIIYKSDSNEVCLF